MQTAFAFRQCKQANYANALDSIRQDFMPDLNSMEPQDASMLAEHGKEAQDLFIKYVYSGTKNIDEGSNERINKKVTKEIEDFHKDNQKDRRFLKNQMLLSSEKLHHFYLLNLLLLLEFSSLAEKDKKIIHKNFLQNKIIAILESNQELQEAVIRHNLNWEGEESTVKQWFRDFIKSDQEYLNYNKQENVTFEDDKALILYLIKKVLFGQEYIEAYWQEQDLNWGEDRAVVLSMLKKTIKEISAEDNNFELQVLSYNWEDDKEFFKNLYEASLDAAEKYADLIASKTSNWDIERLATTDRVILEMAIAEMTAFPSIPVKVTINEYIEVSKRYSTPKSKQFVNGLLDALSKDLIKEGAIKKSGRGLIDNK